MHVKTTESELFEQIGRMYIANTALAARLVQVNAENAKLRDTCDKLASGDETANETLSTETPAAG